MANEKNAENGIVRVDNLVTFLDELKTKVLNGYQPKIEDFLETVVKDDETQTATFTTNKGVEVKIPYGDAVYTQGVCIEITEDGVINVTNFATEDDVKAIFN